MQMSQDVQSFSCFQSNIVVLGSVYLFISINYAL